MDNTHKLLNELVTKFHTERHPYEFQFEYCETCGFFHGTIHNRNNEIKYYIQVDDLSDYMEMEHLYEMITGDSLLKTSLVMNGYDFEDGNIFLSQFFDELEKIQDYV
jgi:hypothetical protein